ncbi:hypothetical protein BDN72DRAFT_962878 [Pluteus cervinus]|uniref:Uncharacterized protein n=1 Tax=Pluteus cervinus TaxID=181527 RepID=A0ACD3AGX8_9AGAR|nr:hypothetical protein BDN72DRAFT_962878 [Pluteus cervinus]
MHPNPKTVEQLKAKVKQDLGNLCDAGAAFAYNSFSHYNTKKAQKKIDAFLEKTPLYDSHHKQWPHVIKDTTAEHHLYNPLVDIIDAVISWFGIEDRKALNTSRVYVPHERDGIEMLDSSQLGPEEAEQIQKALDAQPVLKTAPDIMIVGRGGKCFEDEEYPVKPSYAACATVWEVKLNKNSESFEDQIVQLYVYARQCFYEQRNRDFLHAFLITETEVRLFQFNRALVIHSSRINYHQKPRTFVRMVLGMIGSNESRLGFDMTVFWTTVQTTDGTKRVRKITLPSSDPNDKPGTTEDVPILGPKWIAKDVRGRGTTCWSVEQRGARRLVKNLWRIQGRTPEWMFLLHIKAKNLKGVARMYSFEDGEEETALKNGSLVDIILTDQEWSMDRIWCRITFIEYGPPLESFKSVLQLLCAFYDATKGHWNLWKCGILHRDVSVNNVLFGREFWEASDAVGQKIEPGNRGVLIDLDMAIFTKRRESNKSDIRTGTRQFQSIKVLRGGGWPHDFLDDLESLFLLLAWIYLHYRAPRELRQTIPIFLSEWDDENPRACANAKVAFMTQFDFHMNQAVSEELGQPILKLLRKLCDLLKTTWTDERAKPCPPQIKCVADLHPNADKFYKKFLKRIKTAIEEQTVLDANTLAERPMAAPTVERDPDTPCPTPKGTVSAPLLTKTPPPLPRGTKDANDQTRSTFVIYYPRRQLGNVA